jgi:hypothetical protein
MFIPHFKFHFNTISKHGAKDYSILIYKNKIK